MSKSVGSEEFSLLRLKVALNFASQVSDLEERMGARGGSRKGTELRRRKEGRGGRRGKSDIGREEGERKN
eukprot:748714-Hanusia_phi.AAC.2